MQRKKVAVALMCLAVSLALSSCVKKTLDTIAQPAVAVGRGIATFGRVLFKPLGKKHNHTATVTTVSPKEVTTSEDK